MGADVGDDVLRLDFQLHAAHSGAHKDLREIGGGEMEKCGERFFHPDGAAATADVAREGEQLLHGDQFGLFGTGSAGGLFEIDLGIARHHADEMSGGIGGGGVTSRIFPLEYEGFEYPLDILTKHFGHMCGGEIVFVDLISEQFVGDTGPVEEACDVGFLNFIL